MESSNAGKKKFSLDFIDVILLLIILCAAALLAYIFMSGGMKNEDSGVECQIEYKIQIKTLREDLKGNVNIGDTVKDASGKYEIGEVTNVTYSPYIFYSVSRDTMQVTASEYPDYVTMVVTAKADAVFKDNTYYVDDCKIYIGAGVDFRTYSFTGSGKFISLEEVTA